MNILVFSWRDPKHSLAGGAEQVMHEHMKGWVNAGHRVTLFSSAIKDSPKEEMFDGVHIVRAGHQYHLGVQIMGFLFYLRQGRYYDLVVDQFHGMPFFTPLYVRKPKLGVIQETAREVWFLNPMPWPINLFYGLVGYILEPLVLFLYRSIPFMTGSESAKEELVKFGIQRKNVVVVSHGVIVKKPMPVPSKEKKLTVVFLGMLSKDKGVEDAIRSFALLKRRKDFQFWVIGKVETEGYKKYLDRLVESLGLAGSVKFWGFVSQKKKFELLARAHVLINPSVREGWGLVNIEANAMGTPVIAYSSPGLVDSVSGGRSGILCRENTPKEIAREVLLLVSDKKGYSVMQKTSVQWSNKFSWNRSKERSLELIESIAG